MLKHVHGACGEECGNSHAHEPIYGYVVATEYMNSIENRRV